MEWRQDGNRLVVKNRYETLWLEPWGTDALRVRATQNPRMSGAAGALNPAPTGTAEIRPLDDSMEIRSGRIRATVNHAGVMSFSGATRWCSGNTTAIMTAPSARKAPA